LASAEGDRGGDADNHDMKLRRCAVLLTVLSLAACGSKDEPEKKDGPETKEAPESNDLALPITAPMKARDMLLRETRKANDAARDREKQLDSVINGGR
jgi:predicted small lipoprotein YifL